MSPPQFPATGRARRLILLAIAGAAIGLAIWQPVDIDTLIDRGERLASQPLALAGFVIVQALMFSFALPGSVMVWLVAPFLSPFVAVPVLVGGSVLGALGAYAVSSRLGGDWRPRHGAWLIDMIRERGDFFTQCTLRILPGCPHWAVNYAAGILRLPLPTMLMAATLGLTVKWTVYASAIHGARTASEAQGGIGLGVILPLLGLAIFLLVGGMLRRRVQQKAGRRTAREPTQR